MTQVSQNGGFEKNNTFLSEVYKMHIESMIKLGNALSLDMNRLGSTDISNDYNFDISALGIFYPYEDEKKWEEMAHNFFEKHGVYDEFPNFRNVTRALAPGKIAWWFPTSPPAVKRIIVLWSVLFFLYDDTQEDEMIEQGTIENNNRNQEEYVVNAITGNLSNKDPRSLLCAFDELGKEFRKIMPNNAWMKRWEDIWRIWVNTLKVERDLLHEKTVNKTHPRVQHFFPWRMGNSGVLNVLVLLDLSMEFTLLPEKWNENVLVRDIEALSNCIIIYQNDIASCIKEKGKLNLIYALCEQFDISISDAYDLSMKMHEKAILEIAEKCSLLGEFYSYDTYVMRWIELQKGFIDGMAKFHGERIGSVRYYNEM